MKLIRVAAVLAVLVPVGPMVEAAALPRLSHEGREELASFARRVLSGEVGSVTPVTLLKMSPELRRTNPEQLFITMFRDRGPTVRFGARRNGIVEATFVAMSKARTLPSFDFYNYGDAGNVGLLFERVTERHTIEPKRWFAELPFMNLGVHGISITHEKREGTLPPGEVFLGNLTDRDQFIGRLCAALKLYPREPRIKTAETLVWDRNKTRVELLSFETFVSRSSDYATVDLYRMNDLAVTPWQDKLAVARWLGDKLLERQAPDGRFFSSYDARRGRFVYNHYDIIDHCHAIVTLCDLSSATRDRRYLQAAGKAVDFLKKHFRMSSEPKTEPFAYVVFNRKAKLGAAAMAVVALNRYSELTGAVFHTGDMKLLGRFLVKQQYDDGSFLHYYRYDPKVPYQYKVSNSFPGQATWALAVLERRFNEEVWRKAAAGAVEYLITKREREMRWAEPPADVWLAAALRELCTPFAVDTYIEYAVRMADHVTKRQKLVGVSPDMVGTFEGDPEGSVRGAALGIMLLGEVSTVTVSPAEKQKTVLETCRRAMHFIRLNELRPNNTFYFPEPRRAYGMPRAGSFGNDVRLDTTCHVIEALLWLDRLEKRWTK